MIYSNGIFPPLASAVEKEEDNTITSTTPALIEDTSKPVTVESETTTPSKKAPTEIMIDKDEFMDIEPPNAKEQVVTESVKEEEHVPVRTHLAVLVYRISNVKPCTR
jgi:hypothetical protein